MNTITDELLEKAKKIKWRRLHSYICKDCGKKRVSFFYLKAKKGICPKCRKGIVVSENQQKLL